MLVRATYHTLNKFDATKIYLLVRNILQSPACTISLQILVANFNQVGFSDMSSKKRKYDESYMPYGFTSVIVNGVEKPQCVLCKKVLSNDSIRSVNHQSKDKDKSYFERQSKALKMMKSDTSSEFLGEIAKLLKHRMK